MSLDFVDDVADVVMHGVAVAGVVNDSNMTKALEIMRAEIKEFFCGDKYTDERACIAAGSISTNVVLGIVTLNCVEKIQEIPNV